LYDGTGNLLGTVRGTSAVDPLRSGEPGPFSLTSSIATTNVARVQWSTEPLPAGPGVHRDFRILQDWSLPYGDRKPFDLVYSDPDSGPPYPFVFAGDVDNLSGTVRNPTVVAA
ncbi:MAG: hypothetical protein M3290_05370, partial [Actinomycetota bacterium]|nr:hypothetical protein [Actinomycetota bacterium]